MDVPEIPDRISTLFVVSLFFTSAQPKFARFPTSNKDADVVIVCAAWTKFDPVIVKLLPVTERVLSEMLPFWKVKVPLGFNSFAITVQSP